MSNTPIKFKYKFPTDYNPVYANGTYGGATPNGEIIMNFYLERHPIPYTEIQNTDENGNIISGSIIEPAEHQTNVVRFVSTGVVLSLESARDIHEWLGQHINILEKRRGER